MRTSKKMCSSGAKVKTIRGSGKNQKVMLER